MLPTFYGTYGDKEGSRLAIPPPVLARANTLGAAIVRQVGQFWLAQVGQFSLAPTLILFPSRRRNVKG